MSGEHKPHSVQVLWQEICRAYSGEVIPKEVGDAKRELDGLVEQLETARAEAERSEKYAEDRDLVAQRFEEALLVCRRYLLEDANGKTTQKDYYQALNATEIASNPAKRPT